jgi:hypothetical protein
MEIAQMQLHRIHPWALVSYLVLSLFLLLLMYLLKKVVEAASKSSLIVVR